MMVMRQTDVLADKPSQSHPVRHKSNLTCADLGPWDGVAQSV
jgi:hypothetical protein